MEELEQLLALWNDEATRAEMSDDQLARLEELLVEQAETIGAEAGDNPTQAQLEELAEIDAVLNGDPEAEDDSGVRGAMEAREAAAVENAERATSLLDRIRAQGEGEEPEETPPAEETPEGEETPAEETPPAEAEETPAEEEPAPEAVAAGATPRVSRVAARRPRATRVRPRTSAATERRHLSLIATANVESQGIRAGQPLDDPADLSAAFLSAWEQSDGYQGARKKFPVAFAGARRASDLYPAERMLGRDPQVNQQRLDAVVSQPAITAAGGRCVPSEIRYDLPTIIGTEARPFRDEASVRFGANRGGVVTLDPLALTDVDDAIGFWTEANDQAPSNPAVKPCLTVDCPDDNETIVEAITKCLRFGNFRSKFFGEQIQQVLDLAAVNHSRQAETRWITKVGDNSTQISVGELLGTTRDILAGLGRRAPAIRSLHRLPNSVPLRFSIPFWLLDQIRVDLIRQMPVGTLDETLAVADAKIEGWLEQFNVNVTQLLDGEPGQVFNKQGDGALQGWPDTAVTYLYPEGSWLFLDGGSLDLGVMRDTTTTDTNDFQVFAETFEEMHFHGVESDRIEFDVCPDGSAAALATIDPCTTGS